MDVAGQFGQNLARCRKRANLTQEELGHRAAMGRAQIDIIERGERLPRIDTLVKLAGALSVPLDELLRGIGWRPGTVTAGNFELTGEEPSEGGR
jgi:transcriptional regulator with XRE-family HTH domain